MSGRITVRMLTAARALADLRRGEKVTHRDFKARYNHLAESKGMRPIGGKECSSFVRNLCAVGFLERSGPARRGKSYEVWPTPEAMTALDRVREIVE